MVFVDIVLEKNDSNFYDMNFENGDLKKTDGFATAILMSFFCEKRASASEVAEPSKRRGWWGNPFLGFLDFELGSKMWLLSQARADQITLNNSINYCQEAYQWFVTDNHAQKIEVVAVYSTIIKLDIKIEIFISQDKVIQKYFTLWQNTISEITN